MGFDGGWLRTASPTSAEHASTQREVGRLVLKPPPSVPSLAFRKSVLENTIIPRAIETEVEQVCARAAWRSGRRLDVFGVGRVSCSTALSAKPSDHEGARTPRCLRNADRRAGCATPILRLAGMQAWAARFAAYGRPRSRAVWRRELRSVGMRSTPNTPNLRPGWRTIRERPHC